MEIEHTELLRGEIGAEWVSEYCCTAKTNLGVFFFFHKFEVAQRPVMFLPFQIFQCKLLEE